MSGARPVYISYYLGETEEGRQRLQEILEQVNGVLFTGGNLTLIDKETGEQHPYYKTAKLIVEYCVRLKDTSGVELPILAICQGFELIGIVACDDSKDLLKHVAVVFQKLPVSWVWPVEEVNQKCRTFSLHSTEIIEKMSKDELTIHLH